MLALSRAQREPFLCRILKGRPKNLKIQIFSLIPEKFFYLCYRPVAHSPGEIRRKARDQQLCNTANIIQLTHSNDVKISCEDCVSFAMFFSKVRANVFRVHLKTSQ